jgi:DNA-binding Lrp family transcriptional regulator
MSEVRTSDEKQILEQLYRDGMQSPSDIATETNFDIKEIRDKIEEWRTTGLLTDPVAVVDPEKIGYPVTSYHLINFQNNYDHAIGQGLRQFSKWPGTQFAMIVLGDYDVIARKVSRTESQLDTFATNVLSNPDTELKETFGPQTSQVFDIETIKITQAIRRNGIDIPDSRQRSETEEVDLNETEAEVLNQLQRDATFRNKPGQIAAEVAASREDIEAAIERLEDEKVIAKYARLIDPDVGGWYRAFFGVSVKRGQYENVVDELTKESAITVPYIQSGLGYNWADISMELLFDSIEELDQVTDRLRSISGVRSSRTFLGTRSPYFNEAIEAKS